jgi:hypothetical protein
LPQINPYYPNDCDDDSFAEQHTWNKHLPETYGINLCQVCGQRAKGICPIQKVSFCGKYHQKEYKQHVHDQNSDQQPLVNLPSVYPLYELVVDEEVESPMNNEEERETMFETIDNDSDEDLSQNDLNAIVSDTTTTNGGFGTTDPTTVDFFCQTQTAKDQCVFYHRGHSPLWLRTEAPPQIPNCPYCHAPRQFEFQLQPQLLQYIIRRDDNSSFSSVDLSSQKEALLAACAIVNKTAPEELPPQFKETHDKALQRIQSQLLAKPKNDLDWGVVAVYTCTASCGDLDNTPLDEELGAYREEYSHVQPSL